MAVTVWTEGDWYVVEFPVRQHRGLYDRMNKLPRKHLNVFRGTWRVPIENYKELREAIGEDWPLEYSSYNNYTPKTPMFTHQKVGFDILMNQPRFLIGDEQGTGKTKMLIDLMSALKAQGQIQRVLIIVKASLKYNWLEEVSTHSHESAWIYEGSPDSRRHLVEQFTASRSLYLIVGYETMRLDIEALAKVRWDAIIMDEAHKVKDPNSKTGKAIHFLNAPRKYALTGTPIVNRPEEAYNLLKWLGFETRTYNEFMQYYFVGNGRNWIPRPPRMVELQNRLRSVMLRRRKQDVLDLPDKIRQTIYVDLTPQQRQVYRDLRDKMKLELQDETLTIMNALAKITYLKQATGSVALVGVEESEMSAKVRAAKALVEDIVDGGGKAIIFTQYKKFYERLKEEFKAYNPAYISGDVSSHKKRGKETSERQEMVHKFQQDESCKVFIGVTPACREGLTLTAASYVIFMDKEWAPAYVEQAEDRAHRIGTKNHVTIYTIAAKRTIDEGIERLLANKKELVAALVDGKRTNWRQVLINLLDEA